jgi:hypothetical protein
MPGDSVHALVHRALRGNQLVVANPETIKRGIQKGEPITEIDELPAHVAINRLFEDRRQKAQAIASQLLPCPVEDAPVLHLYDQIRQCILFGLNGTALVLCGMLVEYALKASLYHKEIGSETPFDTTAWEKYEKITLGPAIDRAKKEGIIDDAKAKSLQGFRGFRNRYSHFNIQRVTRDFVFTNVEERNIETGETQFIELPASQTPTLQVIAKEVLDEAVVLRVFRFCDDIVRSVMT